MVTDSYSDKKMFFVTFFKTIRKNVFHFILLFLFLTAALNGSNVITQIDVYYNDWSYYQPYKYYIGVDFSDPFIIGCVCLVVGLSALMLALYNFRFMHTKKTVNVYYSLGVRRSTLFAGKFAACTVLQLTAVLLPFLICALHNCALYGSSADLWQAIAYYGMSMTAVALYPLAVSVFCMALTGSTIEGNICGAVLTFAPTAVYFGAYMFSDLFLAGADYDAWVNLKNHLGTVQASFGNSGVFFNFLYPLTEITFGDALASYPAEHEALPSIGYPVFHLLLFAAFSVAARFAFVKKKTEKAGFLAACPRLFAATLFFVGALLIPFGCLVCHANGFTTAGSAILAIFFVAVAFGLFVGIVAILMRSKEKIKAQLPTGGIMAGALFVFMLVFAFGGFGYEKRIPETEKIVAAGISFNAGQGAIANDSAWVYYGDNEGLYDGHAAESHGEVLLANYLYNEGLWGSDSFVFFEDEQSIETVRSIHQNLLEHPRNKRSGWNAEVMISYKLENGAMLTRVYPYLTLEAMLQMQPLLNTQAYRDAAAIELATFEGRDLVLFSKNCTSQTDIFMVGDNWQTVQDALLDAVISDVRNGNLPMDFVSESTPLGYIGIGQYGQNDDYKVQAAPVHYLPYSADYVMIPVYPSMSATLAVMQQAQLMPYFEDIYTPVSARVYPCLFNDMSDEQIASYSYQSLQFEGFVIDWTYCWEDFTNETRLPPSSILVTDPVLLSQLTSGTSFAYFVNEPGYFVELRYETEDSLVVDALVYVPADKMPSELK